MIIIGAIKLTTSSGNAESTKKARDTIIYALVGLAVTALAGPIMVLFLDRL